MARIFVSPLSWGLGHATRDVPIIRELLKHNHKLTIASSGSSLTLLQKEFPQCEFMYFPDYPPPYTKSRLFISNINPYNPNIIKSIFVKRDEIYKPLGLRSYYRNRIDYGDITANFYNSLETVFCAKFGIAKKKAEFGMGDKNKKLLKKCGIDIDGLDNKDEIILNKKIPAGLLSITEKMQISSDENLNVNLSEEDKYRAFENIIKQSIGTFAPKRSVPIVKNALYRWFKQYLGVNLLENGVIYIQAIILNNSEFFGRLIDESVREYLPEKEKEKEEKIKETEMWNEVWEISENRNYNPNTYKPYGFKMSLYKAPRDKKVYLQLDSEPEQQFIDFLEEHKDKILWWWQNGNEHMALNFGIKYNGGSTFQPDFLVMFKDGRLGIYDTKAIGFNEQDNKLKAEALQKYIDEENKKRKKDFVHGGLVIKNGQYFMINSDAVYTSFEDKTNMVKEAKGKYGKAEIKQRGWQYLGL